MEYKVVLPNEKKWIRLFPIIVFLFISIFIIAAIIILQYSLKGRVNYRFTILFLNRSLLPLAIIVLIQTLLLKFRFTFNPTLSILEKYLEQRVLFIKKRYLFSSIRKIHLLEKNNIPNFFNLFFEIENIRGIKIEFNKRSFLPRTILIFNIEHFDSFIENLKTKIVIQ